MKPFHTESDISDPEMDSISKYPHKTTLTLLLVGYKGAGKTSLVRHYIGKPVDVEEPPTDGLDVVSRLIYVDGRRIYLYLWDTAGINNPNEIPLFFNLQLVNAVAIVFDKNNKKAFFSLKTWCRFFQHNVGAHVLIFIVATKFDNDLVTFDEIVELASLLHVKAFATSAVTGFGVKEAFEGMIDALKRQVCPAFNRVEEDISARRNERLWWFSLVSSAFDTFRTLCCWKYHESSPPPVNKDTIFVYPEVPVTIINNQNLSIEYFRPAHQKLTDSRPSRESEDNNVPDFTLNEVSLVDEEISEGSDFFTDSQPSCSDNRTVFSSQRYKLLSKSRYFNEFETSDESD